MVYKEKKYQESLEEVIHGSSDSVAARRIATLESEGKIRKIAPKLYSSNLVDSSEVIIKRNLFSILGTYTPRRY